MKSTEQRLSEQEKINKDLRDTLKSVEAELRELRIKKTKHGDALRALNDQINGRAKENEAQAKIIKTLKKEITRYSNVVVDLEAKIKKLEK
jgi:hypothetical protein